MKTSIREFSLDRWESITHICFDVRFHTLAGRPAKIEATIGEMHHISRVIARDMATGNLFIVPVVKWGSLSQLVHAIGEKVYCPCCGRRHEDRKLESMVASYKIDRKFGRAEERLLTLGKIPAILY